MNRFKKEGLSKPNLSLMGKRTQAVLKGSKMDFFQYSIALYAHEVCFTEPEGFKLLINALLHFATSDHAYMTS